MSHHPHHNEQDLLLQVAEGNELAFRQLFDAYRNKIYSLGMHLTRSEMLAEEMVQDVFLKVWEKREQLSGINYFNAWLRTVAKNTCSNYLRSMAMEKLALGKMALQNNNFTTTAEDDAVTKEVQQIIEQAIQQLSPQQQKVYLLSKHQGKKQDEIAKELNISIYTVKEYMKLAQRSVKQYIESRLDVVVMLGVLFYLD